MTARVLVIGLDAAESTLLEKWASEGHLPTIARLTREGACGRLDNPMETLPGAIWPEISSGRSGAKGSRFYHEQIHTGEAVLRRVEHDELDASNNYWSIASSHGRRVCVIDPVHTALNPKLNGVQVLEWGLHDRPFSERCHPPELLKQIHTHYGLHPVRRCDSYGDDDKGRQALLDDLLEGSSQKQALVLDLMQREHWDLFACTLGESHCVGHQFWHCLDSTSPRHDPNIPEHHRDAIQTVYKSQDDTIEKLIEAAGPGCTALVFASHGMGPSHAGYHLLPEVLARLGMSSDLGRANRGVLRRFQYRIKCATPDSWLPALRVFSQLGPVKALQRRAGALRFPLESPLVRAVAVPNNRVGGIRLNLKGRDPNGCVQPGAEAHALMEELRAELLKLEDPHSGGRIVKQVLIADDEFGPDHHPDVPDMMVVFRTGHGPIEACRSERAGLVEVPYFTRRTHRSGDHTVESRLWAIGSCIRAGSQLGSAHVRDIAPTVLELLDVPLPESLDGQPIGLRSDQEALRGDGAPSA